MHKGSHDFHITMDDQGFIRAVCIDANSAMMKNCVRELSTLPQYITVTLKLSWVRGLQEKGVPKKTTKYY